MFVQNRRKHVSRVAHAAGRVRGTLLACPTRDVSWILWPFTAIWNLVAFIVGMIGRLLAIVLGTVLMIVGIVLSLTIVGAIIGLPLMILGFMLVVRGLF